MNRGASPSYATAADATAGETDAPEIGVFPSGPIAMVVNPHAGTVSLTVKECGRLAEMLGVASWKQTEPDPVGFDDDALSWLANGIRTVAVLGGDGTIQRILSALNRLWPRGADAPPRPELLLLDGGTMGLLCMAAGGRNSWKTLLEARQHGQRVSWSRIPLALMEVNGMPATTLTLGAVSLSSREYQALGGGDRSQVLPYVARTLGRGLLGQWPGRVAEGIYEAPAYRAQIQVDDGPVYEAPLTLVYSSAFGPVAGLWDRYASLEPQIQALVMPAAKQHAMWAAAELVTARFRRDRFVLEGPDPQAELARRKRTYLVRGQKLRMTFEEPMFVMYDGELATIGPVLELAVRGSTHVWLPRVK